MTLGERISLARRTVGRTQVQLGKDIGSWAQQISGWERGEARPSVSNLNNVAETLGVNPRWLLSGRGWMAEGETTPQNFLWTQGVLTAKGVQLVAIVTYLVGSAGEGGERKGFLVKTGVGAFSLKGVTVHSRSAPVDHAMYCGILKALTARRIATRFLLLNQEQSNTLSEIDLSSLLAQSEKGDISGKTLVDELKKYRAEHTRVRRELTGAFSRELPDLTPVERLTTLLRGLASLRPGTLPLSVVKELLPHVEELFRVSGDLVQHLHITETILKRGHSPGEIAIAARGRPRKRR